MDNRSLWRTPIVSKRRGSCPLAGGPDRSPIEISAELYIARSSPLRKNQSKHGKRNRCDGSLSWACRFGGYLRPKCHRRLWCRGDIVFPTGTGSGTGAVPTTWGTLCVVMMLQSATGNWKEGSYYPPLYVVNACVCIMATIFPWVLWGAWVTWGFDPRAQSAPSLPVAIMSKRSVGMRDLRP